MGREKSWQVEYGKNRQGELVIENTKLRSGELRLEYLPDMTHEEILNKMPMVKQFGGTLVQSGMGKFCVTRNRCFLTLGIVGPDEQIYLEPVVMDMTLRQLFQNLIHVPGIRKTTIREHGLTATGDQFPGEFEQYVPSLIRDWQVRTAGKKQLEKVLEHLSLLGLGDRLEAREIDKTRVELSISRVSGSGEKKNDLVNIANVGVGVSQALPVIVALQTAGLGRIVYIEQPELHLHPLAQQNLGDVLVEAAGRGVNVVVETHSDHLLLRLQTLVAEGKMNPDHVSLNWFSRDKNGQTIITPANLDQRGAFGDWPIDFIPRPDIFQADREAGIDLQSLSRKP
jgi:hypothetical protein